MSANQTFSILRLFAATALILLSQAPAYACSCTAKWDWGDVPGLISFDGRVVDVSPKSSEENGFVRARLQVVRRLMGNPSDELIVVTREMGTLCGAADNLIYAQNKLKIMEFHIFPTEPRNADPLLPVGEMRLSFCGVYPSELDPVDGPRLWRQPFPKKASDDVKKDLTLEDIQRLQQPARPQP